MKNSNIKWIGNIPDNWDVSKFKYNYRIQKAKLPNSLCEDSSLTPYMSMDYIRNPHNVMPQYANNGTYCREEDLLLLWDGSNAGEIVYKHPAGFAPSTCAVLSICSNVDKHYSEFFLRFLETKLRENTNGMGIPHVDGSFLRNLPFLLPPLSIQTAIAAYLDAKCSEIDGLIADINKQIETLNELKKSTITEAVTKGLNKNVKLKDSGIQWIGEIPEGWRVSRLKYLCEITTGNEDTQNADPDGEFPFYVRSPQVERCKRYTFDGEGILIAGDGAGAGRIFHHVFGKYAVHQRVYRLYNFKINTSYLHYYLSNIFPNEMDRGSAQSTVPSMRLPMLLNFNILIPSESEQRAIATYLDTKCTEFDSIISDKQKQISTLEAYKKSLIYEYVTGKNVPPVIDNSNKN